jgi:hypothetical protein
VPTITGDSQSKRALTEAGIFLIVLAIAWYFIWLRYQLNRTLPLVPLNYLAEGIAPKPFQYRALVPWLAGLLSGWGWGGLVDWYRGIEVVALVGLYYSFRLLLSKFIERGATLLAFTAFYALAWNILLARDRPALLPYDITAVAFMTICAALIVHRRWAWYYPLFLLGALNRETILFCTLFFLLVNWKQMTRGMLATHVAVQAALWLGVKALMMSLYGGNTGQDFEYYHASTQIPHWQSNLEILMDWRFAVMVASSFGFSWLLIPIGWRHLPIPELRMLVWATAPYLVVLILLGNLNELRAYAELLPFLLTPALFIGRGVIVRTDI